MASIVAACACRNFRHVVSVCRLGAGGIFSALRTRRILDALTRWPSLSSSGHAEAPVAMLNLGRLERKRGRTKPARAWYAKAIASKHSPAAPLAMVDLANMAERQGRIDEARDLHAKAAASGDPDSAPRAMFSLGFLEHGLGRIDGARDLYTKVITSGHPDVAPRTGADLAPEQADAVKLALTGKVAVLTGGPGCGKSFTVRSVVELARARKAKVVLAAPTGRAAKRLAELTGHEAATIHRLLKLQPGGDPEFDASNPLDADLVVIDETSMVDVILANKLVKAVAPGAHLLLVGDVDQLPSVGAGEVLRDMIRAETLPVVRLTKIFRQAQQSGIVINAHRVNAGRPPYPPAPAPSGAEVRTFPDFYWFNSDETEATAELVADIVARRIPAKFGLDARRDVQVLCPMHRGPAGAGSLNLLLQEALTPYREGAPERRYGGRVFRVGDKVTQLRNNYDKGAAGVFNGTTGVVTGMSLEDHSLTVRTEEDEELAYDFDELDELAHAYAVTIHRSQGSEYPAVVIPLTTSAWKMLQRNLLYTGITRAKKLVVLAGSRRALAAAVRTAGAGRRHTALAHRLQTG